MLLLPGFLRSVDTEIHAVTTLASASVVLALLANGDVGALDHSLFVLSTAQPAGFSSVPEGSQILSEGEQRAFTKVVTSSETSEAVVLLVHSVNAEVDAVVAVLDHHVVRRVAAVSGLSDELDAELLKVSAVVVRAVRAHSGEVSDKHVLVVGHPVPLGHQLDILLVGTRRIDELL